MKYILLDECGSVLKKADKEVLSLNKGDYLLLDNGNYNVAFKTIDYVNKVVIINLELDE